MSEGIEQLVIGAGVQKLVARGLVSSEHNLVLWQHADGSGFGAAIEGVDEGHEVHGPTLAEALGRLLESVEGFKAIKKEEGL